MTQVNRTREATLRFLAEAIDVNIFGTVHGGTVMRWIDQAGYACAVGWCRKACVTVYVGGIQFHRPVHIGHMVEVQAKLIYTGRTSMHIAVNVQAGDPTVGTYELTTSCIVVFVAIDSQGKPTEVAKWVPQTPMDVSLEHYAVRLMELRKKIEEEAMRAAPESGQ